MDEMRTPTNPNQVHGMTIEGVGLVVGRPLFWETALLTTEKTFVGMKNPRIVKVTQNQELMFVEMIGNPEEFIFTRPPVFFYEVLDPVVIKLYTEAISNIKVASEFPKPTLVKT